MKIKTVELLSDVITDKPQFAGNVSNKRQFADRYGFCVRTVDNLLKRGLPHLKIGERAVRIFDDEADAWMKTQFGSQR